MFKLYQIRSKQGEISYFDNFILEVNQKCPYNREVR